MKLVEDESLRCKSERHTLYAHEDLLIGEVHLLRQGAEVPIRPVGAFHHVVKHAASPKRHLLLIIRNLFYHAD